MVDVNRIMRLHCAGLSVPEIAERTMDPGQAVHDAIVREWRLDKERGKAVRAQLRADEMNERMGDA